MTQSPASPGEAIDRFCQASQANQASQASQLGHIGRRRFLSGLACGGASALLSRRAAGALAADAMRGVEVAEPRGDEDLLSYIRWHHGAFHLPLYRQLLGAANAFKEGDHAEGVAAHDPTARRRAQRLLANTRIVDLTRHSVYDDAVTRYIAGTVEPPAATRVAPWTLGQLKQFLLRSEEDQIKRIMPGLASDVIACVVKLMSNQELIAVGQKIFNPLPGSKLGARGYLGARIQPNSPTDNVDDIRWQVLNGWAFAVGDALLGTNPVSSESESVERVELTLRDLLQTFDLTDILPHCVLAHIDVQAEVERRSPGATALWFQSLAGVEDANKTFDISVAKMVQHAATRSGKYGLYFETGQGADATNGHGKGFDMVIHEARKYGFARALKAEVARAQQQAGQPVAPWVHVNDVAGFIGPEVFRSREQLVRCCLEDIVMGKLHGLMIGLDICSTLHMEVDLDDLDWCLEQVMPAAPAYLMALPTKNDPMLSYLTTGYQDHVRLREKFGYRVNDPMWKFFQELRVIDAQGRPTENFGQPNWVYLQYRRRKGDTRSDAEILAEGKRAMGEVRQRGVFLAEGFGEHPSQLTPQLDRQIRHLVEDSKVCLWTELPETFEASLAPAVAVASQVKDRNDYILHPPAGEVLDAASAERIDRLGKQYAGRFDTQIVVSDGLNPLALTDPGHLQPFLMQLRKQLSAAGYRPAPGAIVVRGGRVRAGYRIGERLFGPLTDGKSRRAILHVIGERPGSGHHAFSVYLTAPPVARWRMGGSIDHDITRVISGIADTALDPRRAADETVSILKRLAPRA